MNIDEDDLSDEYDFMDDEEDQGRSTRRRTRVNRTKAPELKYMDLLRRVADREEQEITIDLDDLQKVSCPFPTSCRSRRA